MLCAAVVAVLAAGPAAGQWLEKMVVLPDSFAGLWNLYGAALADSSNTIWLTGRGKAAAAVNMDRAERVARVPAIDGSSYGGSILYNPVSNRLYVRCISFDTLTVIDGRTFMLRRTLPVGRAPSGLALSTRRNKVYCLNDASDNVSVIDGSSDSVIRTVWVGDTPRQICYNSATDRMYISNYEAWTVTVLQCSTDQIVTTIPISTNPGRVVYSPTANKVYCHHVWDSLVVVIDGTTNAITSTITMGPSRYNRVRFFCHNPVERKLYCGLTRWEVAVIDENVDSIVARLPMPGGAGLLVWNQRLDRVYCINPESSRIAAIDCRTDSVIGFVPTGVGPHSFVFDTSGRIGAVVNTTSEDVVLFDAESLTVRATVPFGWSTPVALATDSAGATVWVADDRRKKVIVLDAASNTKRGEVPVGTQPVALLNVTAQNRLYCANAGTNSLTVIDAAGDSVLMELPTGRQPVALAWNAISGTVFCASKGSDTVTVFDGLGNAVAQVQVGGQPAALLWSPGFNKVYVANSGGASVSVIDGATNRRIRNLPAGAGATALCRFGPAGRMFCANSGSGTVTVYDERADTLVALVPVAGGVSTLAADTVHGLVFCGSANRVTALDGATGLTRGTVSVSGNIASLMYCPGNGLVYCTHADRARVSFVDAASMGFGGEVTVGVQPKAMVWSPESGRAYVACAGASSIAVIRDLPVGIEEGLATLPCRLSSASVILSRASPFYRCESVADLVDAAGRRVTALAPGQNDLGRLPPGVYFSVDAVNRRVRRLTVVQ